LGLSGKYIRVRQLGAAHAYLSEENMTMHKHMFIFLVLLAATTAHAEITGRVVAVTDGNTIKVLDETNTEHKVRLTGIDAPERGQPFGTASTKNLHRMVAGKQARVAIHA
jgi:endonuclease YncB( thermonuclease family)